DGGRFVFNFRVDDEGVDGARALFDLNPFLMTRRFVEASLCPILRANGRREGGEKDHSSSNAQSVSKKFHLDLQKEMQSCTRRGSRCPSTALLFEPPRMIDLLLDCARGQAA